MSKKAFFSIGFLGLTIMNVGSAVFSLDDEFWLPIWGISLGLALFFGIIYGIFYLPKGSAKNYSLMWIGFSAFYGLMFTLSGATMVLSLSFSSMSIVAAVGIGMMSFPRNKN